MRPIGPGRCAAEQPVDLTNEPIDGNWMRAVCAPHQFEKYTAYSFTDFAACRPCALYM
jgi:hypothetical protein